MELGVRPVMHRKSADEPHLKEQPQRPPRQVLDPEEPWFSRAHRARYDARVEGTVFCEHAYTPLLLYEYILWVGV